MKAQRFRLPEGGRIDRDRPIAFTFDGRRYEGFAGDTLASALLANGCHLVGRSFKYHRPRGILSAGAEEPNALVQLGSGARTEPNQKATTVELYPELQAASQNHWPSVGFDFGAMVDYLAPLFPVGFYYKTFMWPPGFWMRYEAFIRKAAGMGKAPDAPDPDRYEHVQAHCDVLVAGGGPAGLAAALAAARSGARVILADEQPELGGALLSEPPDGRTIDDGPPLDWVEAVVGELAGLEEVRLLRRTAVFGYYDSNYLGLLERVSDHLGPGAQGGAPRQRLWKVRAKQVVLATGAIERPLVFADNDRPGVMLAGAVRAYVNRYAVRPGTRAVVFTNNDSAYGTALDLKRVGVAIEAVVDLRPELSGELPDKAREAGIPLQFGHVVAATQGRRRIASVDIMALNEAGDGVHGERRRLSCDLLCVSGGWNPAVHLFSQSRGRLRFETERGIFVPDRSAQAERSAGACNGSFTLGRCLEEGFEAGFEAAQRAGLSPSRAALPKVAEPEEAPVRNLWLIPSSRPPGRARMFVDYQNDVQAKDIKLAVREGYKLVEHLKRYTTAGMGTDQGKTGNIHTLAILAQTLGSEIAEVGTTTFRPPYTPVSFGALAGRNLGPLFDPVRKTAIHAWHEAHGAVFEDVGQWKRPWYYPRGGESMREAVNREVRAARTQVGVLDASTLGKIDIRGRDATELLNRVYTNAWSKLEIGRCRYGLMLGEDGMVMDDGVTTRLGEHHYLMSTTTGNAAPVFAWLEELLQTEWLELEVYLTSVTEQWATVSLCGPNSRKLLSGLTDDIALGRESFPHMSMKEGHVAGIAARVMRISFTGEPGFEINVPASYGMAVWKACMTAGEAYGITPYGTEAMHVLRAEKGYIIVGQDTDGTITPHDLGMDWIVSKKKRDFIGKRSLTRSDMLREDRKQLVGLLTDDAAEVLAEGAQIVAELKPKPPMTMVGHVTSSYESPNVGRSIALALVKGGRARMGEKLFVPMEDKVIPVTVTDPVFFDPEGARLDG